MYLHAWKNIGRCEMPPSSPALKDIDLEFSNIWLKDFHWLQYTKIPKVPRYRLCSKHNRIQATKNVLDNCSMSALLQGPMLIKQRH